MTDEKARTLRFEIFRMDPSDPQSEPRMQEFELDETPYMTLFLALNRIREEQAPSLQFDFACRSAVCGSCGMMVNGRPVLGCRTLTADQSSSDSSTGKVNIESASSVNGASMRGPPEARLSRNPGGGSTGGRLPNSDEICCSHGSSEPEDQSTS